MKIQESAQNYLEAILMLQENREDIHAVDIGAKLGFSRATVSEMLRGLKENGYVTVDDENHIALTGRGREIAEKMYDRHHTIADIFMKMGVSRDTALEDACRVEHYISNETYEHMKAFFNKDGDNS